jgi:hypothetical protein
MQPSVTIVAEGDERNMNEALSALHHIPQVSVTEIGEERGIVEGAGKLIKWAVEFAGDAGSLADALIRIAEKYFAGSSIKVRYGDREIEISNVRRDELIEVLNTVKGMAEEAGSL